MLSSENIEIGGFPFDWILFPCLEGLSKKPNNLSRFNSIENRFGVYIFFHETGVVPYIGLCGKKSDQKQDMKTRIGQYFKHDCDSGNIFAKNWMEQNDKRYKEFKSYIAECQLGTLSIESNRDNPELTGDKGVLGAMESFLIYIFIPAYNSRVYRLTNDEENYFGCFVKSKNPHCRKTVQGG